MEDGVMWFLGLAVICLSQAIVIALKIGQRRDSRKVVSGDESNPGYGERIKGVETEMKNLKEHNTEDHKLIRSENREDHELIRKDVRKIFTLLNGFKRGK